MLFNTTIAQAHEAPPSAILLDIGLRRIDVELQLPLNDLSLAISSPLNSQPAPALTTYAETINATYNNISKLIRKQAPLMHSTLKRCTMHASTTAIG